MKTKQLRFGRLPRGVRRAQGAAAELVLAPGAQQGGGPGNRHRGADQRLFVPSGGGVVVVEDGRVPLKAGRLPAIERGERHRIRNSGRTPLKTLDFHHPPAFDAEGEPVGRGNARSGWRIRARPALFRPRSPS